MTTPSNISLAQIVSLLAKPHSAPAALPSIPAVTNDWDTFGAGEPTSVIVALPHVNGSIIAGLNPGIAGAAARGTIRVIVNQGGSNTQNTGNLILAQDTPGNTWPFHLAGRRPSLVIPSLGVCGLILDPTDKWFPLFVCGVEDMVRSIDAGAIAPGALNAWNPVDITTGLSFRYSNTILVQPGVGVTLNTMDFTTPAGSSYGERFSILNGGSGMTIANQAGAGGPAIPDFRTPDGVAFIIPHNGMANFWYDASNNVIWCDATRIGGQ